VVSVEVDVRGAGGWSEKPEEREVMGCVEVGWLLEGGERGGGGRVDERVVWGGGSLLVAGAGWEELAEWEGEVEKGWSGKNVGCGEGRYGDWCCARRGMEMAAERMREGFEDEIYQAGLWRRR